jgi:hypothetical protein
MKRMRTYLPLIMVLVLMLVAFATSCDKRNPPPVAPPVQLPQPPSQQRVLSGIAATPDTIYADNGITFSTISITVKDGEGFGVPGQLIKFKTDFGRMLTNVFSDSTGVARSTFWDEGHSGQATIWAFVKNYSETNPDSLITADSMSVIVKIDDIPPISALTLEMPSSLNPQPLNVMQGITVRARARNILGNDVPDNTLITFSATKGYFSDVEGNSLGDSLVVETINGRATCTFNAGPIAGAGVITARIANQVSSRDLLINPGRPSNLNLRSFVQVGQNFVEADTSSVSSPNYIWMRAELKDLYNNVCPSRPVKFTTNLGTFVNTVQEITTNSDLDGLAQVRFTPGLQAGAATITAFANGDTLTDVLIFNIRSNEIHSIQFAQAGQIDLNVANTGGVESAIIKVKLYDINGNLIDSPQNVYFKILNQDPPAGVNLNNQPVGDSVLVVSSGGEAQISINSGTESGIIMVKASCTRNGRYVSASKPNIVIHSGPPHTIIPFISGYNTGVNMGGGIWKVIGGANVYDVYGNPVSYGTSVWFNIPDNVTNTQIVGNSYVGNESANGDSTAGVAYTEITYSGVYSFEQIRIIATTIGPFGVEISGEAYVILPLNQPQLELELVPGNLVFHGNNPPTPTPQSATAFINASLFDVQGCAIHNARLSMTSTRGVFEYTPGTQEDPSNSNTQADPNIIVTDWYDVDSLTAPVPYVDVNDNEDGLAQGLIRFYWWEIPNGDPVSGTPGTTSVTVTARILGTNTSAQSTIILLRYPT